MELRHLRYFVAVAETLHFGRAAEALGIAQPPLSQQIRQLEDMLGVQLLHRTNKRQVQLTDAGRVVLEEARLTLAQAERVIQTAHRAARGEVGRLDIGLASLASYTVALEILRTFRDRFPHVSLILNELQTADQVRHLCAGQLHLGFLYPPVETDELTLECVQKEPLVAVLPQTHPLSTQLQLPLPALAEECFILFPRHMGPGLYDQIVGLCRRSGFRPRVIQEANHTASANLTKDTGLMNPGGHIIVIGGEKKVEVDPVEIIGSGISIVGVRLSLIDDKTNREIHAALYGKLEKGSLRPVVDREIPLAEAPRAHHAVARAGSLGKICLIP